MKKMKLTRKEQIRRYAIKSGALTLTLAELAMPKPKRKPRPVHREAQPIHRQRLGLNITPAPTPPGRRRGGRR